MAITRALIERGFSAVIVNASYLVLTFRARPHSERPEQIDPPLWSRPSPFAGDVHLSIGAGQVGMDEESRRAGRIRGRSWRRCRGRSAAPGEYALG